MLLKNRIKSIFDVFSRRRSVYDQRNKPDVIPERLRNRILLLYRDVISGRWNQWSGEENHTILFWEQIHNSLVHLHGSPWLSDVGIQRRGNHNDVYIEDSLKFLMNCETDEFFDFIELSFKLDISWRAIHDKKQFVEAINEIFRIEHMPYQLTPYVETLEEHRSGVPGRAIQIISYPKIICAEDDIVHHEAVVPALSALSAPHFKAANAEFREAMDEYRKGQYGDCLTKCGSAFESVLKVLCKRKRWSFSEKDTAAPLLKVVINNSSLDSFFEQPLMLIATIRNRLSSSHGAGSNLRYVGRHIGQYAVSSTAAAIALLVNEVDPEA